MFSSSASQVSSDANFIEDVFQTWLYTGNGSTQTITNGIDLAGKGGLVWTKARPAPIGHGLVDTARGGTKLLQSNTTAAEDTFAGYITSFNANGYTLGASGVLNDVYSMVSWTFRKQPKFFDVVTYTGNGANRTIAHNLGSAPGCIIVKRLDSTSEWYVYHRSLTSAAYGIELNNTGAQSLDTTLWNSTAPTTSVFSLGTSGGINASGGTYVAYLFAHNAGGFGLTGNDNVISCGSFAGGSTATVNLGYEPQFLLIKAAGASADWNIIDTMRGWSFSAQNTLVPNSSAAESNIGTLATITPTGFTSSAFGSGAGTVIYIAIRRGPMKVPTTGTSVYNAVARTGDGVAKNLTGAGFAPDSVLFVRRTPGASPIWNDKLRGPVADLFTPSTSAEDTAGANITGWNNDGVNIGSGAGINVSGTTYINWLMRRAPGFFDEVCYSGAGAQALTHNLGVVPEMFILKNRAGGTDGNWIVYHAAVGNTAALQLNLTATPAASNVYFNSTSPTSTVFTVGTNQSSSGGTYVAYLFASCPGVSKVGSYTGNGSNQTINCGFTGGARFVMIKRTDSTGDWYVWDTARGIVSGNDPRLSLNTTAAEVTTDDSVDTDSTGFVVNQLSATNINVTSATYIFLSIS